MNEAIAFSIIAISLIVVIIVQENRHAKERRDLYTRLMAADLTEYKQATGSAQPLRLHNSLVAGLERNKRKAGD